MHKTSNDVETGIICFSDFSLIRAHTTNNTPNDESAYV